MDDWGDHDLVGHHSNVMLRKYNRTLDEVVVFSEKCPTNATRLGSPKVPSSGTAAPTFALVTPYTGDNLGDGAIQEAVIWNIRSRFPDAVIYGITLNPADTAERHEISSYPIAGPSGRAYSVATPSCVGLPPPNGQPPSPQPSVWDRAARSLARAPMYAARILLSRGWAWKARREMAHIVNGFRFVKYVNVLVISGGGQLDDFWGGPWAHPYAMLKWVVLARLRGARPVFLSVGFGTLDSRLSRLFVRTALRLAAYRSYRDAGSRDLMKRAGFRRDDPVYPDLAYSLPLDGSHLSQNRRSAVRVVGLSPFCYCDPRFWPRKDASAYDAYLRNLTGLVRWLVTKKYRVSLFASDSPDQFAIDDLWGRLSAEMSSDELRSIERHHVVSVQGFLDQASRVDLMVASRLHGVLLAQREGTPVIALSFDRKVDVQMESVGHSSYRLSIDNFPLSEFQQRFDSLQANLEVARQQIQSHFSDCADQLETQYDAALLPAYD